MNLSRIIAEVGPAILEHQIAAIEATGGDSSMLKTMGPMMLNALSDQLLDNETNGKKKSDSHFIAHIAAELLRDWPGEPTLDAADQAVRIAKRIVDQAEKVCSET